MKKTVMTLAAVMLASMMVQPRAAAAEGTADTAGIELDFNRDGTTDRTDWEELREFVRTYQMENEEGPQFSNQEVPATINLLINNRYGNRQTKDYGIDVSGMPEYYLPSIGGTTGVKDQDPFGTCWAFGTISAVESNLLLQRSGNAGNINPDAGKLDFFAAVNEPDLSELYLSYSLFSAAKGQQEGEGAAVLDDVENGRFMLGGFASGSQKLLTSWSGPLREEMEPYEPVSGDEYGNGVYELRDEAADEAAEPEAHVQKFVYLNSPALLETDLDRKIYAWSGYDAEAVDFMKQAIVKYGALMLSYAADTSMPGESGDGSYFNYENWAQYDDRDEMGLNHMVSIVGWNDHYPKENFKAEFNAIPPGDGAFLVKNSWGNFDQCYEKLGDRLIELMEEYKGTENETVVNRMYNYGIPDENGHGSGYFWLSYYDHSMISVCALEADDAADGFDYDHNYQYDFAYEVSVEQISLPTDNEETKTANVFTAEGYEDLKAVSVYASQADCTAEIRIISQIENTSDVSAGTVLAEQTVTLPEKGFHTVVLDAPVRLEPGMRFAVEERVISEHEGKKIAWLNLEHIIRPDLQTPDNINEMTVRVVSNPGETYAYVRSGDGFVWTDIETLNKETDAAEVFEFGSAYIKAYTSDVPQNLVGPDTPAPDETWRYAILLTAAGMILAAIIYLRITNRNQI